MSKEEIAEDLRGGANYIREHGWAQHAMELSSGEVCAMGGVRGHCGTLHTTWQERDVNAVAALARYLMPDEEPDLIQVAVPYMRIADWATHVVADWNDECADDGEQVAQCMEKAAAQIEEQA